MCGICAIIGVPSGAQTKIFTDLLQIGVTRGWHSTGVFARSNKQGVVIKDVGLPQPLMLTKEFNDGILSGTAISSNRVLIGHNRAATKGSVTVENAHPFAHDHIAMAHNGTLWDKTHLEEATGKVFDTDSEAMAWAIAKKGIDWAWERMHGAASIVYWDQKAQTLNIASNGQRPLHFAKTVSGRHVIIASEAWMIRAMVHKHDIELQDDQIWYPPDNTLYTFLFSNKKQKVVTSSRVLPPVVPLPSVWASHDYSSKGWGREYTGWRDQLSQWYNRQEEADDYTPKTGTNIVPFVPTVPEKIELDEPDFHLAYPKCVFCNDSLEHEYQVAVIIDEYAAACEACSRIATAENIVMN